jgi:hypothetical protein
VHYKSSIFIVVKYSSNGNPCQSICNGKNRMHKSEGEIGMKRQKLEGKIGMHDKKNGDYGCIQNGFGDAAHGLRTLLVFHCYVPKKYHSWSMGTYPNQQ